MYKSPLFWVFALFILGFILRVLFLPGLSLTFGYDQARDAFISQEIISGDLKVLGPPASTPGLYHGVFYYYLLAPAYFLGKGSPIVAAYFIALLNAAAVFLVFWLTKLLSKSVRAALIASFLFAVSFEATQYATWLSNPTIGVWTVPLIYIGLWLWISRQKKILGATLAALGLGLSIQAEIFLAYHLIPVVLWLFLARKQVTSQSLVTFVVVLGTSLLTMLLVEFKFGFKSIGAFTSLLGSGEGFLNRKSLGDYLTLYLNQFGRFFANSTFPSNAGWGGALGVFLIFWLVGSWRRKKAKPVSWQMFLLSYLIAHISVVSVGGTSTPFLMVGLGVAAVIVTSIFISSVWEKSFAPAAAILIVLAASNISTILSQNQLGATTFSIQKEMTLLRQLKAVDYTYSQSQGQPFSINTLTSPLWINTTWSYLYNWYGKDKYGYLPEWHGRDQVGQLGNNLSETSAATQNYFFIIEPQDGIPPQYLGWETGVEDTKSILIEEVSFGAIKVQKRQVIRALAKND
ncbi:hypothetical protein A2115_03450 [Candidatus Woesebacteria bacterium GWA1_41_8]|uniref:Glycosyltransferase RgtA/B/C/D-like domain-containing protein n=1 Tax=Candidatus Woesebacteria bacterium GWA1_41_8 TaxID=1802471 RepID=A0A1F7WL50_9BACT|nr:MAG: hypothetical protein A2115_03450 [Candidatus Woesebacteria bacterium GWA1_41_8]